MTAIEAVMTNDTNAPPLDAARFFELKETLDMDAEGVKSFVFQRFINTVTEVLPLLGAALSAGDAVGVRQKAHQLKGSALNAGASGLSEIFWDLEELGKRGDLTKAQPALDIADSQFGRFKDYLSSLEFPPK